MATPAPQQTQQIVRARDLASVALRAATELDNLIHNRQTGLDGIRELAQHLSARLVRDPGAGPASLADPTATVVLGRAAGEAVGARLQRVDDVARATANWVAQMRQIIETHGEKQDALSFLVELRSFCLAVSRHATAMAPTPLDRPDHPFRR